MHVRLAIPARDCASVLPINYGLAVQGESPRLNFPDGFYPSAAILNAQRITRGDLILVCDPLQG